MEKNKWKKDIKECSYGSPADFLWFYVLNGCGCGSSDDFKKEAWEVFESFANGTSFELKLYHNPTKEILAHWLDSKDLIEHGISIQGSWLNENGKELFDELNKKPQSDDSSPIKKISVGML